MSVKPLPVQVGSLPATSPYVHQLWEQLAVQLVVSHLVRVLLMRMRARAESIPDE